VANASCFAPPAAACASAAGWSGLYRFTDGAWGCDFTPLYAFSSFTFTTLDTPTGRTGPTSLAAYGAAAPGYGTPYALRLSGGIQLWIVPMTGTYTVTCAGAGLAALSGSGFNPCAGAVQTAAFYLEQDTVLRLVVGQLSAGSGDPGDVSMGAHYGGSGGSFVFTNTSLLLACGGSGSQHGGYVNPRVNCNASLTELAHDGVQDGAGGIGPAGGKATPTEQKGDGLGLTANDGADGQPGIAGAGGNCTAVPPGQGGGAGGGGGWSIVSSFLGGRGGDGISLTGDDGGFGLGGGAGGVGTINYESTNAGGGGYGGGGAAGITGWCSGGGSSFSASPTLAASVSNLGPGYITIVPPAGADTMGINASLYHGWSSPVPDCATGFYDSTQATAVGGVFPYIASDSLACLAWKLAATICTVEPSSYSSATSGTGYNS
jgi:hypothetical protein